MQILLVNKTISVLVDHVEGFLELLDLRLVEHREDVGRGPLGAFLGGLSFGALAGHGGSWMWACARSFIHIQGEDETCYTVSMKNPGLVTLLINSIRHYKPQQFASCFILLLVLSWRILFPPNLSRGESQTPDMTGEVIGVKMMPPRCSYQICPQLDLSLIQVCEGFWLCVCVCV